MLVSLFRLQAEIFYRRSTGPPMPAAITYEKGAEPGSTPF